MKIRELLEGGPGERRIRDLITKGLPDQSKIRKGGSAPTTTTDREPSEIYIKGYKAGYTGREEQGDSTSIAPLKSYRQGFADGRADKEAGDSPKYDIKEMTSGSVASSMGNGNGFVNGGPGTKRRIKKRR